MSSQETSSILISAHNTGIGLWTTICLAFADVFGCSYKNYERQANDLAGLVASDQEEQMDVHPDYDFGGIRLTLDKSLSFTGSVTERRSDAARSLGRCYQTNDESSEW